MLAPSRFKLVQPSWFHTSPTNHICCHHRTHSISFLHYITTISYNSPIYRVYVYTDMIQDLNSDLAKITGFAACSTQPNSGAQGEYAGLLCIREYHRSNGDEHRDVCLIPVSAHGTNPASASMCGMKVVVVKSDNDGNIDLDDLKAKADKHKDNLAALMITYPSTYGVFEEEVKTIIDYVHDCGGQVYMDGANMNAQVALTSPGGIGADVCFFISYPKFFLTSTSSSRRREINRQTSPSFCSAMIWSYTHTTSPAFLIPSYDKL